MKICNYCKKEFDNLFHPRYCSVACRLYSKATDIGGCRIAKRSINYSGMLLTSKEAAAVINCGSLMFWGYKTTCGNRHCVYPSHVKIEDFDENDPFIAYVKTYFCKWCKVNPIKLPNKYCSMKCSFEFHAIKINGCMIFNTNTTVSFKGQSMRVYRMAMEIKTGESFDGNGVGRTCGTNRCYAPDHIFPDYDMKSRKTYSFRKDPEKDPEEALAEFLSQK